MSQKDKAEAEKASTADSAKKPETKPDAVGVEEIGGPKGPDPTRFGDWSVNGRCIDF